MPILEGSGVTKYFGGLAAVSDVDFHIEQGEIAGMIGPNGAGKTTLFNLISAALSTGQGEIKFKGQVITGLKPYRICRMGIARTFQSVNVFPNMTAVTNVHIGSLFGVGNRISPTGSPEDAESLLDFVGLTASRDIPARDLTLVNQKRVEVARALATRPELLLLDELMAGLNHTEVSEAMELVTRIRDRGITIFMIEHVMKAIMGVCDRIFVLHHGVKIAEGTPQEIANNKTVVEVYLGE